MNVLYFVSPFFPNRLICGYSVKASSKLMILALETLCLRALAGISLLRASRMMRLRQLLFVGPKPTSIR